VRVAAQHVEPGEVVRDALCEGGRLAGRKARGIGAEFVAEGGAPAGEEGGEDVWARGACGGEEGVAEAGQG